MAGIIVAWAFDKVVGRLARTRRGHTCHTCPNPNLSPVRTMTMMIVEGRGHDAPPPCSTHCGTASGAMDNSPPSNVLDGRRHASSAREDAAWLTTYVMDVLDEACGQRRPPPLGRGATPPQHSCSVTRTRDASALAHHTTSDVCSAPVRLLPLSTALQARPWIGPLSLLPLRPPLPPALQPSLYFSHACRLTWHACVLACLHHTTTIGAPPARRVTFIG